VQNEPSSQGALAASSIWQKAEHPSQGLVLPSSQVSGAWRMPSPQSEGMCAACRRRATSMSVPLMNSGND
jgi:hypothetical protein